MDIGKSVKNIFDLVHRFGNEEDQISANFGFIMKINPPVLSDVLRKLQIDTKVLRKQDFKRIEIETQVPYKIDGEPCYIDLILKLDDKFLVFFESKIWGNKLTEKQTKKYAKLLIAQKGYFGLVRFVYISQFDQREEFRRLRKIAGLKGDEFCHFRWEDIRNMVEKYNTKGRLKFI
ncbi:MAG: PD-(D/E)XK nuclease family protein, partial [Candidatus Aminicenantales bacterium]